MLLRTSSMALQRPQWIFLVPDNLCSLRKSLRQLVEAELRPHDAAIEENGQIPSQALDATGSSRRPISRARTNLGSQYSTDLEP
jgi:hypothetical protein